MAPANACASPGGTSNAVTPSSTISGSPPALLATTGRPAAIASKTETPSHSYSEGRTKTSIELKKPGISPTKPANSTSPPTPSDSALRSSVCRCEPSPAHRYLNGWSCFFRAARWKRRGINAAGNQANLFPPDASLRQQIGDLARYGDDPVDAPIIEKIDVAIPSDGIVHAPGHHIANPRMQAPEPQRERGAPFRVERYNIIPFSSNQPPQGEDRSHIQFVPERQGKRLDPFPSRRLGQSPLRVAHKMIPVPPPGEIGEKTHHLAFPTTPISLRV